MLIQFNKMCCNRIKWSSTITLLAATCCHHRRRRFKSSSLCVELLTITLLLQVTKQLINPLLVHAAIHENLCLEDDYTNDLPIFIEKQTICNFDTTPVHVYTIKTTPDTTGIKFCLKGECAEKFNITKEKEVKLFERLSQPETNLKLQIIRTLNDIAGTPTERRQAINAIQFNLNIEDCNRISWQTIVVAILSSVCVALMSSLAIMLILYQQKGLIKSVNENEDDYDDNLRAGDKSEDRLSYASNNNNKRDESFINPRRTSSNIVP